MTRAFQKTAFQNNAFQEPDTSTEALTDAVTLTSSVSKTPKKVLSSVLSVADSLALRRIWKAVSDPITITEARINNIAIIVGIETVVMADAVVKMAARSLLNTINISDSILRRIFRSISDSITITDIFSRSVEYWRVFVDTTIIIPAVIVAHTYVKIFSDVIVLSSTIGKLIGKAVTSVVTIAEAIAKRLFPVGEVIMYLSVDQYSDMELDVYQYSDTAFDSYQYVDMQLSVEGGGLGI